MGFLVLQGYGSAMALIMAIGAQNAFVLGKGVQRHYHWPVAAICISCDVVLISAGMLGAGFVFEQWPWLLDAFRVGGVIFLSVYGFKAFQSFLSPAGLEANTKRAGLRATLLTALAVSLLNPHVYLDTVILLGSLGSQHQGHAKLLFWVGAMLASFSWFIFLTLAARKLSPWLEKPHIWRWVDLLVALMMWSIALWLVVDKVGQ